MEMLRDKRSCHCIGIDISETSIDVVTSRGLQGYVCKLPVLPDDLDGQCFDVCVMVETLEHLSRPGRTLQAIAGVLEPGGRLIVSVPDDCMKPEEFDEHITSFDDKSLCALLSQSFQVHNIFSFPCEGRKYLIAVARRAAARSCSRSWWSKEEAFQ